MPSKLAVSEQGRFIALCVTDKERLSKGLTDVLLCKGKAKPIPSARDLKYVNRLVFFGDNLLVFSLTTLTRIDGNTGAIIWQIPEFFRLAGPYAVELSPDKRFLSILTAELDGHRDNAYRWSLHLLAMADGKQLSKAELDSEYPLQKARAIDWTGNQSFNVRLNAADNFSVWFE